MGLFPESYEENSHRVVPVRDCRIEDEACQKIMQTIEHMHVSFKIRPYNEDTGFGLFRHVLIRRGFQSGEILVVLVTASTMFPSKNNFVKALRKEHPEITSIVLNINDRQTSMVLGDREQVLYGPGIYPGYSLWSYLPHLPQILLPGKPGADGDTLPDGYRVRRSDWKGKDH